MLKQTVCPRCLGAGVVKEEEHTLIGPAAKIERSPSEVDKNWDLRPSQEFTEVRDVPTFKPPRLEKQTPLEKALPLVTKKPHVEAVPIKIILPKWKPSRVMAVLCLVLGAGSSVAVQHYKEHIFTYARAVKRFLSPGPPPSSGVDSL